MSNTTLTLTDEGQSKLNAILRTLNFLQTSVLDRVDSESETETTLDGYHAINDWLYVLNDILDGAKRELHGVLLNEIYFSDHDDHATVKRGHARNPLEMDSDEGKGSCA